MMGLYAILPCFKDHDAVWVLLNVTNNSFGSGLFVLVEEFKQC